MDTYDWREVRVLITGAGGFVGSNLAQTLHSLGAQVVGLVPNRSEKLALERRGLLHIMDVWYGSILDEALVQNLTLSADINVCIHLAAISEVRRASLGPTLAWDVNVRGTWNVLEACRRITDFRAFVGASSDKAYGDHGGKNYVEDFALRATHAYDVSKACADMVMRSYAHQYAMPVSVTRCANIYGPGDLRQNRLIPNTIRRLCADQPPLIHSGADTFEREFLHVSDAVRAYLWLVANIEQAQGNAYNVASGEVRTVRNVIDSICREMNVDVPPVARTRERNFKEIPLQRLDGTKLRKLGWRPSVTLDNALRETVSWYRKLYTEPDVPPLPEIKL